MAASRQEVTLKLIWALLVAGGLVAAVLLVPLGGETAWQRAQAQGLPQAALRSGKVAARGAGRWLSRAFSGSPAPAPVPPAHEPKKRVARAAPPQPAPLATQPSAQPPSAPAPQRDHIVAAPREQLGEQDRNALEQLITARGK